jgi:hypothetical protein
MIGTEIDGGEIPVQSYAVGHLMPAPCAISKCDCDDCGGELVPVHPFENIIHTVDDAQFETPFDNEIGFMSMMGDWRERMDDLHDDDRLMTHIIS